MLFSLVLALLLEPQPPAPPKPKIFCSVVNNPLTESQQKVYDNIKKHKTTVSIQTVLLNPSEITKPFPFIVQFDFKGNVVTVRQYNVKHTEETFNGKKYKITQIDWEEKASQGFLSILDDMCSGLIYLDKKVYAVQALGGGLHALVEIDQSKFPKDHPPERK